MKKGFTAEIINREPQFSVILHSIENLNVNEQILCQVAAAADFTPIHVSLRILFQPSLFYLIKNGIFASFL